MYSIMCNFEPHRFFFFKKSNVVSVEVSYSYLKFPVPKYKIYLNFSCVENVSENGDAPIK